jgi:hypothetical protein
MPFLPSSSLLPETVLSPFVTAMIIPTGTGASIGGFAGDATPYMNLLASVSDVLITHPNVANAAVFQQLPTNALYVEGYGLDQFMQGNWILQPVRQNRIGVVFDAAIEPEMLTLHLNTINAAKSVYGLDIVGYTLTREPVQTSCTQTPSGCSSGTLKNPGVILEACAHLLRQGATAIALCTQLPELETASAEEEQSISTLEQAEKAFAASNSSLSSTLSAINAHYEPEEDDEEDDIQEILIEVAEGDNVEEILLDLLNQESDSHGEDEDEDETADDDEAHAESVAAVINTMLEDTLLVASEQSDELEEEASSDLLEDALQISLSDERFKADVEASYRQGQGVDPIGGLEGILSHLVVSELGVPCAHAPVFSWEIAKPVLDEVLNPKAAAEFIAPTFLPCVLMGLSRAPQMRSQENTAHRQRVAYSLSSREVSVLVTPANALGGIPVLAALEQGIPILAVQDNQTVLNLDENSFAMTSPQRRRLIRGVRSYEEAAGAIQMLRLGLVANFEPVAKIELK